MCVHTKICWPIHQTLWQITTNCPFSSSLRINNAACLTGVTHLIKNVKVCRLTGYEECFCRSYPEYHTPYAPFRIPRYIQTEQYLWLRPEWKTLLVKVSYSSNNDWARRFRYEDNSVHFRTTSLLSHAAGGALSPIRWIARRPASALPAFPAAATSSGRPNSICVKEVVREL